MPGAVGQGLEGLDAASWMGGLAVFAGLTAAAIALLIPLWTLDKRWPVVARDQSIVHARALFGFAGFLVFVGAVLLLGGPAIQTADPARRPPPEASPTATDQPSPAPATPIVSPASAPPESGPSGTAPGTVVPTP